MAAEDADSSKRLENSNTRRNTTRPADQTQMKLLYVEETEFEGEFVNTRHCRTKRTTGKLYFIILLSIINLFYYYYSF